MAPHRGGILGRQKTCKPYRLQLSSFLTFLASSMRSRAEAHEAFAHTAPAVQALQQWITDAEHAAETHHGGDGPSDQGDDEPVYFPMEK